MNVGQLPKVELHLHLDCGLSYGAVSQLIPGISPAEYQRQFIAPAKCADLADFLAVVPSSVQLMQTADQLRLVTQDLFDQLLADNVIYAEIRFAPLLHTAGGLSAEEVVTIVEGAVAESSRVSGVEARLILCTLRHFSEEQSLETARLVEQFKDTHVAGFDIAADEAGYPIDAHIKAFRYAHQHGIPCTAHAGEARGPESVWETLENLQPGRLGHGVRSIEDPNLMAYLRQNRIHLEVCPAVNVQIDIYPDYVTHPIDQLYRAGLSLSVNTDARTTARITLNQEYERLNRVFGWGKEHFLRCNTDALRAAFLPSPIREELLSRLLAGYRSP